MAILVKSLATLLAHQSLDRIQVVLKWSHVSPSNLGAGFIFCFTPWKINGRNLQITHVERKMIWTKPPWGHVPYVNLPECKYVHLYLGKMIQFDSYFSNGLKPPSSNIVWIYIHSSLFIYSVCTRKLYYSSSKEMRRFETTTGSWDVLGTSFINWDVLWIPSTFLRIFVVIIVVTFAAFPGSKSCQEKATTWFIYRVSYRLNTQDSRDLNKNCSWFSWFICVKNPVADHQELGQISCHKKAKNVS